MSRSNNKLFITVGAIGLIALACLNWLIVVDLLFLALIIWLASNDINNGGHDIHQVTLDQIKNIRNQRVHLNIAQVRIIFSRKLSMLQTQLKHLLTIL